MPNPQETRDESAETLRQYAESLRTAGEREKAVTCMVTVFSLLEGYDPLGF